MQEKKRKDAPGQGRPTAEQASKRHLNLLDRSLDMFLENGYEQTSLNSIAAAMNMTKRTIYSLYKTKEDLFEASVQRAIENNLVPKDEFKSLEQEELADTLKAIAITRVEQFLSETGLRLQRVINAESHRFPKLALTVYERSTRPTIEFLKELFIKHEARGEIELERPEATAAIFLSMTVGATARGMLMGGVLSESSNVEDRIDHCVRLFLNGIKPR